MPNSFVWCFTVQTRDDEAEDGALVHLSLLSEDAVCQYICAGREVAPTTGQRHLQCYVRFNERLSFQHVRTLLPECHLERARGTAVQNLQYCRKEGDFVEYGVVPHTGTRQGQRTDWDDYADWCRSLDAVPSDHDIITLWPSLFARYRESCRVIARELAPRPVLRDGALRDWQQRLYDHLSDDEPDDRTIEFYVDTDGGSGKSWFSGYVFSRLPGVQLLGPGRRDDLAHMVRTDSRIFIFNIPREQMQYLQYGVLEMIKDRMICSPKYESTMKILTAIPFVIVFSNEEPDYTKLTDDRINVVRINS
jgi:hypothetical protein